MSAIKLYFSKRHKNLGDIASPLIMERVFNTKMEASHYKNAQLFGIGSLLQKIVTTNFFQLLMKPFRPQVNIFGTGFIQAPPANAKLARKVKVLATRGAKTKAILEDLLGQKLDIPLGDPGIFLNTMLKKPSEVTCTVGIIPHYKELNSPEYQQLAELIPGAKIISVLGEVEEVMYNISQCEAVISSSLHGLIAADSLNIPNVRICHEDVIGGGDFKYEDYYSAFNIQPKPLLMEEVLKRPPTLEWIKEQYEIRPEQVEQLRAGLIEATKKLI